MKNSTRRMSHSIHQSRFGACALSLALVGLVHVGWARADEPQPVDQERLQKLRTAVDQRAGRVLELYVCGDAATFDVEVHPWVPVMLRVEKGIQSHDYNKQSKVEFILWDKRLYILAGEHMKPGETSATRVWGPDDGFEFTAHLTVVDKMPTHSNIVVHHIAKGARPPVGRNPCNPTADRALHRLRLRAASRHGKETRAVVGIPEIDHVSRSGDGPDIDLSLVEWDQGHMVLDLATINPDFEAATLTRVEVTDKHGKQLQAELWPWSDPNKPGVPSEAVDGASSLLVPGGGTAKASLLVRDIDDHSMRSMVFKFHGRKGAAPFVTAIKVYRMVPVTDDEDKPEPVAEDKEFKQLTVSARGSWGGYWVPYSVPGLYPQEPTTTTGLAVRVSKGLGRYLAVEGEIAGGVTGAAEFEPGMSRSATHGRVVLQGVARVGKVNVGSVRLGTGLQVARYGGTEPDMAATDIEALYALGAGFDRRLGDVTVGVHFQYVEGLKSGASTLGVGLQVGYGWTL